MRLPTNARQLPTSTPTLPSLFASSIDVAITEGLDSLPRTISRSFITLAGLKKWWPITCCGSLGRRGDLVDVERRCVGCQDGIGPSDAVEFGEDLLLERHALEDGLDDDVGLPKAVEAEGRFNSRQAFVHLCLRQPALLHGGSVVLADRGQPAIEGRLIDFLQEDGDSRIGVGHGDSAAHRPGPDHRGAANGDARRILRDAGNLGHLALGEEDVDERLGLVRKEAFAEEIALALAALGEWHCNGGFNRLNCLEGGDQSARPLLHLLAGGGVDRRVAGGRPELAVEVAGLSRRAALRDDLAREGDSARQRVRPR